MLFWETLNDIWTRRGIWRELQRNYALTHFDSIKIQPYLQAKLVLIGWFNTRRLTEAALFSFQFNLTKVKTKRQNITSSSMDNLQTAKRNPFLIFKDLATEATTWGSHGQVWRIWRGAAAWTVWISQLIYLIYKTTNREVRNSNFPSTRMHLNCWLSW